MCGWLWGVPSILPLSGMGAFQEQQFQLNLLSNAAQCMAHGNLVQVQQNTMAATLKHCCMTEAATLPSGTVHA